MIIYLDAAGWAQRGKTGDPVVAPGGEHGLSATFRTLRHITRSLTMVVTVTNDRGSPRRTCQKVEIFPLGDLRVTFVFLCEESEWGLTWRDALQTRLGMTGPLNGHAFGNPLVSDLWQLLDDPVEGLGWAARLLGMTGRALPIAVDLIDIEMDMDDDGRKYTVSGQPKVAATFGTVEDFRIRPEEPKVPLKVIRAISGAKRVVLGPGSRRIFIIPYLFVPDLRRMFVTTNAH